MVEHLRERGEPFVKDGKLVAPRPNVLYSPLYPAAAKEDLKVRRALTSRPAF